MSTASICTTARLRAPNRWLDLQRYFTLLRPADDIVSIKYFTAPVSGAALARQDVYLRALDTLPLVTVILGKFKTKQIRCRHTTCTFPGSRFFTSQEEKRTDVAIATHLVNDAYCGTCDNFIIVSGDSDLVPALNMVKSVFPAKKLFVYVPARNAVRGAAVELRAAADQDRLLPLNLFPRSQFAATMPDGVGGTLTKPPSW
jgi:uncharacterized LabA/DUF88 family protein